MDVIFRIKTKEGQLFESYQYSSKYEDEKNSLVENELSIKGTELERKIKEEAIKSFRENDKILDFAQNDSDFGMIIPEYLNPCNYEEGEENPEYIEAISENEDFLIEVNKKNSEYRRNLIIEECYVEDEGEYLSIFKKYLGKKIDVSKLTFSDLKPRSKYHNLAIQIGYLKEYQWKFSYKFNLDANIKIEVWATLCIDSNDCIVDIKYISAVANYERGVLGYGGTSAFMDYKKTAEELDKLIIG
ncbi:MAG: hypothetical protein KBS96_05195 [Lachnospiraceae bacterium]|nr:hypothetical protein [Candidatus Colinaster scatohippi]